MTTDTEVFKNATSGKHKLQSAVANMLSAVTTVFILCAPAIVYAVYGRLVG